MALHVRHIDTPENGHDIYEGYLEAAWHKHEIYEGNEWPHLPTLQKGRPELLCNFLSGSLYIFLFDQSEDKVEHCCAKYGEYCLSE